MPRRRRRRKLRFRRHLLIWPLGVCVLILYFYTSSGANMSQSPALQESDVFNRAIPREAGAKKLVETQRHPGMQNQNIDGDEHPVTTDLVLEQGPGSEQYSHCFNSSASGKLCYASSASQRTPCFSFRNHNTNSNSSACVPHTIIFGWPKAGTSALFYYLSNHPQIQLANNGRKEMDYFSHWLPVQNVEFLKYLSWFPSKVSGEKIMIEASTEYATSLAAPRLMKQYLPHVRLIALLRDPVQQVYSYHAMRSSVASFQSKADTNTPVHCGEGCSKNWTKDCSFKPACRFLGKAVYYHWLFHWMEYFPKENFLFIRTEDLWRDPLKELRKIERFININEYSWDSTVLDKEVNAGGRGDIYDVQSKGEAMGGLPPMPDRARNSLQRFFAPHNRKLKTITGWAWNYTVF